MSKKVDHNRSRFSDAIQKAYEFISVNKYLIGIIGSLLILVTVGVYSSLQASAARLSAGDQYNLTYMVKDWHPGDTLNLLSQRTNLLKLPLVWLQGQLPYGFASYYTLNAVLVVITLVGWSVLSYLLLKRKAVFIASNLILSGLMLGSTQFATSLTMPAIRNVEYLLVFGFVLLCGQLLKKHDWAKWGASFAIFGLLVASDYLYLYTLSVAAIAGVLYVGHYKKLPRKQISLLVGCIVGGSFSGLILLYALDLIGVLNLIAVPRTFIAYADFWPQAQNTMQHILVLFGGDFFGKSTGPNSFGYLLSAGFAGLAVACMYKMRRKGFAGVTMSVFALLVLLAYLLSAQAVSTFVNIRYIAVVPLIGTLAVLMIIRKNVVLIAISCTVLLAGITLAPANRIEYGTRKNVSQNFVSLDNHVVDYLKSNHVQTALGTFAYSAPTWFYTHKKIDVYTIKPCNGSNLPLSNTSWYESSGKSIPTALIVDRAYSVNDVWETWTHCPDQVLEDIYGVPASRRVVGTRNGSAVEVWVYRYDIRSKLQTYN